jgi:hypothetical protein
MKWCWILSEAFCASIEMIRWFLSLLLLMFCITFIDFHIVRFCRVKTMPHVERKDLLDPDSMAAPLRSGSSDLGELGSGLYRRGQAVGRERVSGL